MYILSKKKIITTFGSLLAAVLVYGIFNGNEDKYKISQGASSFKEYMQSNKKSDELSDDFWTSNKFNTNDL